MSTLGAPTSHATPWVASAAVAGIIVAASVGGSALRQQREESFPIAPEVPSVVTSRLQDRPHLSQAWRIHHAQSRANAGHPSHPTTTGGRVRVGD